VDHFSFSFCVLEVKELHLLEEDKREDRVGTEAGVGGSPALEEGDWTLGPEDLEETVQGAPVLTGLITSKGEQTVVATRPARRLAVKWVVRLSLKYPEARRTSLN